MRCARLGGRHGARGPAARSGFTLIEVLVATALTLMMISAVVGIFAWMTTSVSDARATLEMAERLRAAGLRLQEDLAGCTATMLPPCNPAHNGGYFEYVEFPLAETATTVPPVDDTASARDATAALGSDILMFTTRAADLPFTGKCQQTGGTLKSPVAEVAWFLRGRTLYRRMLLVAPGLNTSNGGMPAGSTPFYGYNDVSVRWDTTLNPNKLVANSLGDLTNRENRFAHYFETSPGKGNSFPYDIRLIWGAFRLPTMRETSSSGWNTGRQGKVSGSVPPSTTDLWSPDPSRVVSPNMNNKSLSNPVRFSDDVMLTNVLGFDVKIWDPGAPLVVPAGQTLAAGPGEVYTGDKANGLQTVYQFPPNQTVSYGAFADLGWGYDPKNNTNYSPPAGAPVAWFAGTGNLIARTYDTWSTDYHVGSGLDGADGFDNPDQQHPQGNGVVDDLDEKKPTAPPYPYPARGIQVKIRAFDPTSRQIREWTVVHDFLPR